MLKFYGTLLCKDCVALKNGLDAKKIPYEFLEFEKDLSNLKEFLKLRDGNPLFDEVRKAGGIGIPLVVLEDGSLTLDYEKIM